MKRIYRGLFLAATTTLFLACAPGSEAPPPSDEVIATGKTEQAMCSPSNYPCQAAMRCYGAAVAGMGASGECTGGSTGHCIAYRYATGDAFYVPCGASQ